MTLQEYARNPFISKLPSLKTQKAMYRDLLELPIFDEKERQYPSFLRKHCIARLAKCFLPQARQVELADRFALLLRQGYLGRDPLTHDYLRHLHNGIERIDGRSLEAKVSQPTRNTASSFALLGCPGVGKTLAMNRVLDQYPQTIQHDTPFSLVQIVWLRLEAPALGSLKQLCLDFFQSIDTLIGTDYVKRYAIGTSVEQMLVYMAHVAHLHALGVLVIDEIQNLSGAKVGAEPLMKFLVKLVNTIGVPVIPIGTLGALPILQRSFSQARRSTGLGSLLWDRMEPGSAWNEFLKQLWGYQWTYPKTDMSDDLSAAIYDESQGVADLAVKLFMLAQLRLVGISEMRKGMSELMTATLIRRVAKEEFAMVAPMIRALRTNDAQDLRRYDDLRSLNDHIGLVLGRALNGHPVESAGTYAPAPGRGAPTALQEPIDAVLLSSLTSLGVAEDVARQLVSEVLAKEPSADPLTLLGRMAATLSASPPKVRQSKVKPLSVQELPHDDLRSLVQTGKEKGQSAHQALLEAGVIRPPILDSPHD